MHGSQAGQERNNDAAATLAALSARATAAVMPARSASSPRTANILTFTTLYPSKYRPTHGVFVENRLRHLYATGQVNGCVVAPVPWFPLRDARYGRYADFARTPTYELRNGIAVYHPRYPLPPKIGMAAAPWLLAMAMLPVLRRIVSKRRVDVIDAHYFYPDGVAAVLLGKWLKKPVVVTARGTDINLIPKYKLPRRAIAWAGLHADAIIAVCGALKDELVDLGVAPQKVSVMRNGVDLALFRPPKDRTALRAKLGISAPTILSVGELIPRKGHDLVIQALAGLPGFHLIIAGQGSQRQHLERVAQETGVAERVRFVGVVPHDTLPEYYGATDVLALASSREGWANVLLESMACGTPVVATKVWGTPEVVAVPEAGRLSERTPAAIAHHIRELMATYPDRNDTRRYAEGFSWQETTDGQLALFAEMAARGVR